MLCKKRTFSTDQQEGDILQFIGHLLSAVEFARITSLDDGNSRHSVRSRRCAAYMCVVAHPNLVTTDKPDAVTVPAEVGGTELGLQHLRVRLGLCAPEQAG